MPVEFRTSPELAPPPGYAHVAIATGHRLVVTAGGVPLDSTGALVGEGDVPAQTRQVIANLLTQLELAGAGPEDVLKTTVYVVATDNAALVAAWDVVQESPLARAASTLLGVASLGYTGQLVEIEAIAAIS
ncbi:MAG: RidA family protein [Thermomicrobiales bacterium]